MKTEPKDRPLSAAEREMLDRRLEEYRRAPDETSPWQEVKERIMARENPSSHRLEGLSSADECERQLLDPCQLLGLDSVVDDDDRFPGGHGLSLPAEPR